MNMSSDVKYHKANGTITKCYMKNGRFGRAGDLPSMETTSEVSGLLLGFTFSSGGEYHREKGPVGVTLKKGVKLGGEIHSLLGSPDFDLDQEIEMEDCATLRDLVEMVEYMRNSQYHNEAGPAVIKKDGDEEYWLYGEKYSPEDWQVKLKEIRAKRIQKKLKGLD